MKGKVALLFVLMTLLGGLAIATPAEAEAPFTTGTQIPVFFPETFQAYEPFHFANGFISLLGGTRPSQPFNDIKLYVDGVEKEADFSIYEVIHQYLGLDGVYLLRRWIFNFPDGMSGSHDFKIEYYLACYSAVESGYLEEDFPCSNNGANPPFLLFEHEGTITFIP